MKPKNLSISGWGPYKDKVDIDFSKLYGQGLFLITGATGAGKTTIFDAITYALYGALSGETRDKERSSVRSDFALPETQTYVELIMEHGGKEYFIRRNPEYLRPKKRSSGEGSFTKEKENATLRMPDGKVIEGVREVNGKIQDLMGVDLQQFKQLSMIAQGEFAKLLTASPKDKTKIFREIFGTGIYERFTYNLSKEAKKRYQKVAEQKAKLDEDMRILAGCFKTMDVEEALKEEFIQLSEGSAVSFDKVKACLEAMEKELSDKLAEFKKDNEKNEKQILKTQSLLTAMEEENKRIRQYISAEEEKVRLEEEKESFAEKERRYNDAINASWLEADAVQMASMKQQIGKRTESLGMLEQSLNQGKEALLRSQPILERREELTRWILRRQERDTKEKELGQSTQELSRRQRQLEAEKLQYVALDKEATTQKSAYEEALRKRSYAAIGLAAQLLEEGKPCPVCGALEHPNPARLEDRICSEEEIEQLQKGSEKARKLAEAKYGQIVSLTEKIGEQDQYILGLQAEIETLSAYVEGVKDIPSEINSLSYEKATKHLQDVWDNANSLKATTAQQEKQLTEGKQELQNMQAELAGLEASFAKKLGQHGFDSREAYEAAYMDKLKRDRLEEEIRRFKEKLATATELCKTLRENLSTTECKDTLPVGETLQSLLQMRKELTSTTRSVEYSLNEVKRCKKQVSEKEKAIHKESEEYGFIKELENIASGNNPKRLVFEQYVLASYFEEILRAANIRFRKMSAGRYEMRRSKEVSDGRVKDNLEIEVMDFYTGKPRSVRTLSGGESFKASLSLALGLSDVIQSMSGGIKVDALFIDEGFGALDSESLDQACNTLNALVENNRLIGIISHVPELRERISSQLVIEKSGSGSSVKMIV